MYRFLVNLQSKQQIKLDTQNSLIIGRSNVVGCTDKRVSRNHGKLTCTVDGKIHVVALHTNPCFFTRNGVPPVLQLNKNEEETLNEGDCLGLLPDEFWFQITSEREPDVKAEKKNPDESTFETYSGENCVKSSLQYNKMTLHENIIKESFRVNENSVSFELKTPTNFVDDPSVIFRNAALEISTKCGSSELEKIRLPIWMYEIYDTENDNKSPAKKKLLSTSEQNNKKPKMFSEKLTKDEESSKSCTIEVNKQMHLNSPSTSRIPDFVESSEGISNPKNESSHESLGGLSSTFKKNGYEICAKIVIEEPSGDVLIRPICQYEGSCYRENSQHKLEFSHPGDVDFVTYENRPLCPHGSACYRKSRKHKTEYRHPSAHSHPLPSSCSSRASSPLPPKRRRKTNKSEDPNYEDEDDHDLEDPFTNDASSDEYIPSDCNSEEEKKELDRFFKNND